MPKDIHPFLGINYVDGKAYVVLFDKTDSGMVVFNETLSPKIKFGMYGDFDEDQFEFLSPDTVITLTN